MRNPKDSNGYLRTRTLHKWSGIFFYFVVKSKLFFLHRLEDTDQVIFPGNGDVLQLSFAIYMGVLVVVWMLVVTIYLAAGSRFRNKSVPVDSKIFNSAEKTTHLKLLDLKSDQTLGSDLSSIFKDIIWVMFEDRVFDVTTLDHPGGRFIIHTLCGKEISRYLVGAQEYTGTISSSTVQHKHSPFALNLLEERFVGFAKTPRVLDRYHLVVDSDMTMLSLSKLVQLREDRQYRMRNDNFAFDFAVFAVDSLAPDLSKATFKAQKVRVSLSETPFLIFGKAFNVRVNDSKVSGTVSSSLESITSGNSTQAEPPCNLL